MDARSDSLSKRDATIASLIAFGLGVVLTAFLLAGSEIPLKCIEGGNIADWFAAMFTGLVGFGACWFAYDANRHRKEEVKRQELRESASRSSRLAVIFHACVTAGVIEGRLAAFEGAPAAEQTLSRYTMILRVLRKSINRHDWAGLERGLLDDEGLLALNSLELRLLQFDDLAEHSLTSFAEDPDSYDDGRKEAIEILLRTAKHISATAKTLAAEINRLRADP